MASARPLAGMAMGLMLALAGCVAPAPQPEPRPPLLFPPPPEAPRFIFERSLTSTADLQQESSTSRLRQLVTGERRSGRGLAKPFDVAACRHRIYVSDTVLRYVMVFDVAERRAFDVGVEDPGSLIKPLGVNTDAQCRLYVVDAPAQRVMIYDRDGKYLRAVGGRKWFQRLSHVAVTPDGRRIFAVDTGGVTNQAHRVRVFDAQTGEHLYDIGRRGKALGELNLPRDAEIGPDGLLYVVDGANFRVSVFTQEGKPVRTFGGLGDRGGQFSRPKGIALGPAGNVYVSDAAFGNFQIFTSDGRLLLHVGERSTTPARARYLLPAGIDVDEDGRVLMVGQFFRKVDIYRPAGLAADQGSLGAWNRPSQE